MTADPLLFWQLDDIVAGNVVPDFSPSQLDGTIEGDPKIVPDDQFGACLLLDGSGDAVLSTGALPAFTTAYTMSGWVRVTGRSGQWSSTIMGRGSAKVFVAYNGNLQHNAASVGTVYGVATGGGFTFDTWHHLAITRDGPLVRTYLDGVVVAGYDQAGTPEQLGGPFVLGRQPNNRTDHSAMATAAVRLYDRALDGAEIQEIMAGEQTTLGAFVRSHPLDFELANVDQQPVLYIDDAATSQTLTLRVTNSSRHDITLWPVDGPVSANAHHLRLSWRAGTLATISPVQLATPDWTMSVSPDRTLFHLLGPASTVIPAGGSIELALTGLRADGTDGTRGSRVELGYQRLGYTRETSEIVGTRQQVLEVVNHRGRPDIPLAVGFVGGDRVLSTGSSPSSLRMRVANVSREVGIALTGATTAAGGKSALVLSFDVQLADEVRGWALTRADQLSSVQVQVSDSSGVKWDVEADLLGTRAQWTLTPQTDTRLAPNSWLELAIGPVYGLASPGHAPLVLAYRDIPGFQDGFVSTEVERAPLLFAAGRVGIGTADPQARLHLVDTTTNGTRGSLIIGPTAQPNLRLGYDSTYSWVQSHGPAPLAINPVGNNVGIGTTTPQFRLSVQAVTEHLQLRREGEGGGNQVYLELYQSPTTTGITYPSIRFHHAGQFWHRIEGRPEGIMIKWGPPTSDRLSDIHAAQGVFTGLKIGGVTIGENELRVLQLLAAGRLEIDLFNVRTEEYAYAAPNHAYDADCRYVFTWRRQTTHEAGRWRLRDPKPMLGS